MSADELESAYYGRDLPALEKANANAYSRAEWFVGSNRGKLGSEAERCLLALRTAVDVAAIADVVRRHDLGAVILECALAAAVPDDTRRGAALARLCETRLAEPVTITGASGDVFAVRVLVYGERMNARLWPVALAGMQAAAWLEQRRFVEWARGTADKDCPMVRSQSLVVRALHDFRKSRTRFRPGGEAHITDPGVVDDLVTEGIIQPGPAGLRECVNPALADKYLPAAEALLKVFTHAARRENRQWAEAHAAWRKIVDGLTQPDPESEPK